MILEFAGIRRKTEFSPNHVVNDSLIINQTGEALAALGAKVTMYDEGSITVDGVPERLIFSMVQGPIGSRTLQKIENAGAFAINSAAGVMNCYRTNMVRLIPGAGIPFPKSIVMPTDTLDGVCRGTFGNSKVWVKRGDVHAVHKEDVTLAANEEEAFTLIREFQHRSIIDAVLQEHLDGDTVKFYALRDADLFHWYYLNDLYHSPFNEQKLRELAVASAEVMGLYVFGGDAIIGRDGSITIIDINDWPSFAPIRDQASRQIAKLIYHIAQSYA